MVTRRMASVVHRCQFRSGLFTPVTDHQLQRMPAFRVEVRYSIRNAEPCVILSTKRRERCVFKGSPHHFGLRTRLAHFCRAARRLLVCPKKEIIWGEWSARGSDTIERPSADSLAEEKTILQFESFMCEKEVGPEDRAKCFKQLGKDSVSISIARTPELAVEEVGPLNPSEVIPDTEQHGCNGSG